MQPSSQLEHIRHALRRGDTAAAVKHCRALLHSQPQDPEVLHLLGLAYLLQQRPLEAEGYLLEALKHAPRSAHVLNDLGIARLKQARHAEAARLFALALEIDAGHSDALNNMAVALHAALRPEEASSYVERLILVQPLAAQTYVRAADNSLAVNEVGQAIHYGRKAVRLAPTLAAARLELAEALEVAGQFKQARFEYLAILERNPQDPQALARLLSLRDSPVADQYATRAEALLAAAGLSDPDRAQLHFALAHFHDQGRRYDRAFAHLRSGNALLAAKRPFDHAQFARAIERIIATFSSDYLQRAVTAGADSRRPIFIVGMPRSGTTLLEQILASHPRIEAGGELPTVINIAAEVSEAAGSYPEGIRRLNAHSIAALAARYLARLDRVSATAVHVTDKMPFNYMHLGLIALLLPGAPVIHCRRDALDTCLSCYFTAFNEHVQLPGDLEGIGQYYLGYRRLMAHWRSALPRPPFDVDYERLVTDTEQVARAVLEFCSVEWDPACIAFHRTARGVRTPSRWQVRQPIYTHSVGRWHHYAAHLDRLLEILTPATDHSARRAAAARDPQSPRSGLA